MPPCAPSTSQQDQVRSTGLFRISITKHLFRDNKSKCALTCACPAAYWGTRVETMFGARRADDGTPLVCKESLYFEQVCIDRRHSCHSSGKADPKDWFGIRWFTPTKAFYCGKPLKRIYALTGAASDLRGGRKIQKVKIQNLKRPILDICPVYRYVTTFQVIYLALSDTCFIW